MCDWCKKILKVTISFNYGVKIKKPVTFSEGGVASGYFISTEKIEETQGKSSKRIYTLVQILFWAIEKKLQHLTYKI
jgi:hypothetical protein